MRRIVDLRAAAAALLIATALAATPVSLAGASPVDDQERKVDQIADRLDRIEDQHNRLTTALAEAEAAKAELDDQIAEASERVAALEAQVGHLESELSELAINAFVHSGAMTGTPIFGDAARLSDGLARDHLTRVAMDLGDADADEYDALLDDLERERAALQKKQAQATAYAEKIADDRAGAERLHADYESQYTKAQAELGQLLEEEEQRRAEAAYARMLAQQEAERAARAAAQQPAATSSGPGRGGGAGGSSSTGAASTTAAPPAAARGDEAPASSAASTAAAPPVSGNAGVAINAAMGQLGVPYRYAASSPGVAFDCSGLTAYAWGRAGVSLPHQSGQQYASTPHVPKEQAQPGDLIFYYSPIGHVGIYLGGGQMIHAPRTGDVVKVVAVNWGKVVGVSRPG